MGSSFGDFSQSAIRSVFVILYLLPFAFYHKSLSKMMWRRDWKWLLTLLVASCFISGPLYYAYNHAGVAITTLFSYTGMLIGYICFGMIFSKEKFTKDKLFAVVLSVLGLVLTFGLKFKMSELIPVLAALSSGLAIGYEGVAIQKIKYSATQSTIIAWTVGIIVNVPIGLALHEKIPTNFISKAWLYLLIFSVISVLSSWFNIAGSKLIEAGAVGIIGLCEVVFGVLFGVAVFHEKLSFAIAVGMILIVGAASLPYIIELKGEKS